MREFEEKRKLKNRIYSKFTIVFLVVVLLFLLHGTFNVFLKKIKSSNNLNVAEEKLETLKEREAELESQIKYLESNIGKEEEARLNFSLAKEGEKEIVVLDEDLKKDELKPSKNFFILVWQKFADWISF